jgi:3'(2'), 5'-bisphosphate nucleotidase
LLASVSDAAREAGALLMKYLRLPHTDLDVETKADESPVSRADRESSALLVEALGRILPGVPVVSEEDVLPSFEERSSWKAFLLVDPLDGTKEYLRGSGDFAVNIAYVEGGAPLWGVMFCPAIGLLAAGGSNAEGRRGAWISHPSTPPSDTPSGALAPVAWTAIPPPVAPDVDALRAVLSQSHRHGSETLALERFGVASVTRRGSSLKFLMVAQGEADVYFRRTPTWEWDTAAGQAILEGVEAVVCDAAGAPLRYNRPDPLNGPFLACPRAIQDRCLERLQRNAVLSGPT